MKLYHISPYRNNASIGRMGLLPDFAVSDCKRVYAVQWNWLAWAVAHTSARKDVSVNNLTCWVIHLNLHPAEHGWRKFQHQIWYNTQDIDCTPAPFDIATLLSMYAARVELK